MPPIECLFLLSNQVTIADVSAAKTEQQSSPDLICIQLHTTATSQETSNVFIASADNLDDLMRKVFTRLLSGNRSNFRVTSRKGESTEAFGALLELKNPRARLGRSKSRARVFSPLGELLWYLGSSQALDHIRYYIDHYEQFSDDGKTLNGAYGPRIFSPARIQNNQKPIDEWQRVIDTLRVRQGSRNAIIQIYANSDGAKGSEDIPCTCTLHFVIREGKLYLHVHMRSNDAFLGMPHDIFAFTMLQEIAGRELEVEIGSYQHSVASLHLYDDTDERKPRSLAQQYLDEGLHDIVPMPPMPTGNPWPSIQVVLEAERELRAGNLHHETPAGLDPYWKDLITLLRIYATGKHVAGSNPKGSLGELSFRGYELFILDRVERRTAAATKDMFQPDGEEGSGGP